MHIVCIFRYIAFLCKGGIFQPKYKPTDFKIPTTYITFVIDYKMDYYAKQQKTKKQNS